MRNKTMKTRTSILIRIFLAMLFVLTPEVYAKSSVQEQLEALQAENARLKRLLSENGLDAVIPEGDDDWAMDDDDEDGLLGMSMEALMQVEVTPVGSLTRATDDRHVPAVVTKIDKQMIFQSGAHSLNELLDIYVPNLQFLRQAWEAQHLGLRGITGDRDDKYLLLINGRNMNEKTHYGALSERDQVMLGDIHHIDVIRGPGSATYGPGAIMMVLNIVTDNAKTFQGLETTIKGGMIENFASTEVKYGRKLGRDEGFFFYAGVDKYSGSDHSDSPFVSGQSFTTTRDKFNIEAGKPFPFDLVNDRQAYQEHPRVKLHVQYNKGNFDLWARYTKGGQNFVGPTGPIIKQPQPGSWWWDTGKDADDLGPQGMGYQQFTVYSSYKQEISDTFYVDYALSYDHFDFERLNIFNEVDQSHGEDELYGKVMAHWDPDEKNSLALGAEVSLENWGSSGLLTFGVEADDDKDNDPDTTNADTFLPKKSWNTTTMSLMGEYQLVLNDQWTTFLGGRLDKNTYTHEFFSPRAAAIYTPSDQDTFKFMLTESVRMTNAEEMRWNHIRKNDKSKPETIKNIEVRYERQHTDNLWFALGSYMSELDMIAWDNAARSSGPIGIQKSYGVEGEIVYTKDKYKISASHGYTKLLDFDEEDDVTQFITSQPMGFGDNLANWSNHITKIQASYDINDKWKFNSSARIYWGFDGAKEFAEFRASKTPPEGRIDDEDIYGASVFLNFGLQYDHTEDMTFRVDATNVLGWVDYRYNKYMYGHETFREYRSVAPSLIFSFKYKF